jgi:hypothetical protein
MNEEIPLGTLRYSISCWQESYGNKRWSYVIRAYKRVCFKRSKRIGWRNLGFVCADYVSKDFATREEALTAAKIEKAQLK